MSRSPNDPEIERIEREIESELAFHLDMRTRSNLRQGMSHREARREAQRRFGNVREIKSSGLSILAGKPPRRGPRFEPATIRDDLRIAARRLRREPFISAVLVALIALGIAANAAIFGVANAVVLRPLDFPRPERLVRLYAFESEAARDVGVSPPDLADWATSDALAGAALFSNVDMRASGGEEPRTLPGGTATEGFFDVLGIEPTEGRRFTTEEFAAREHAIILTERGRSILLGTDSNVLGATLRLDGEPWTVVGIIPQPDFPFHNELYWVPWTYDFDAPEHRGFRVFNAVARLAPGVTLERARTDLEQVAARLADSYPDSNEGWSVRVLPFHESMLGNQRQGMLLLLGGVTLLLSITCSNVAALMLARTARWRHETAVRGALGADRWRLVRHLAADSLLVTSVGGLLALPLTKWGIDLIKLISPATTPPIEQAGFDGAVGLYAFALIAVVVLATGMTSAWSASRADLMRPLRVAAAGHTGERGRFWRKALVGAEAALATVLIIGAGLLVRSFVNIAGIDLGYRHENVLAVRITPFAEDYPEPAQRNELYRNVLRDSRRIAGVERAALVASMPQGPGSSLRVLRGPGPDPNQEITVEYQRISRGYFDTLEIPFLRGRDFTAPASVAGEREIIVSESLARAVWPDDAGLGLGRTFDRGADQWRVVGVVADVRSYLKYPPRPTMYIHYAHDPGALYALLRTTGEPESVIPAFRAMLWSHDPNMPLESVTSIEQRIAGSVAGDIFRLRILGSFTLIAVALSCLGIYGMVAHGVARRAREIGVRTAMGATRRDIVAMIVGDGMLVAGIGIGAGILAAAGLTRFMSSFLYEVSIFDPVAFTLLPGALAAAALAACLLPSRRAASVDPMVALRSE